ncbi:hypothetical protein AB0E63_36670 [Kribbella sp. NPDC026596]|uniref:hypothetical protein n=1 Tax=Kribbella sp. NPDC026596 TaxID=3155122 RepID=UPI0033F6655C
MPDTSYPYLRDALDDRFSGLTDAELDSVFTTAFGEDVTPLEYEEFFSGLGKAFSNFAQQAAPVAATALQGGLEGGMQGMKYGPYGALVGALAGGTGAALQKHTTGTGRDVGSVISGVVNLAGGGGLPGAARPAGPPPAQAPAAAPAPPAPATDQLLRLLGRPEMVQALAALLGGQNAAISAGPSGTPVPANAYAGLLSALAKEAEAEAASWDEATSWDEAAWDEATSWDEAAWDEAAGWDEAFEEDFPEDLDAYDEYDVVLR